MTNNEVRKDFKDYLPLNFADKKARNMTHKFLLVRVNELIIYLISDDNYKLLHM